MATSAIGGSQIDVSGLAQQLVAAERAPLDQQITRETSRVTTQISALGALKSGLSSFQDALASLKTTTAFAARTATSADPTVYGASADATAAPGSYDVEVVQLAKAQQLASNVFIGGSSTVVGTGKLTLTVGGQSFSVAIGSTNSTLEGIRNAINAAPDNTGVAATIVQTTTGSRLILSARDTGAANVLQVSQADGDGGLAQLAYTSLATTNYTEINPAQDAIIKIATFEHRSGINTISEAIDGVTLKLVTEQPGETFKLTVGYDGATAATKVKSFVDAYNALQSQIIKLRGYDATTKTAGAMLGDAMLNGIERQLRRVISTPVAGVADTRNSLASIGVKSNADGTLTLDSVKLQKALDSNFDGVAQLFGSESGVAATLASQVEDRLGSDGAIESRSQNLVKQKAAIDKKQAAVDDRMAMVLQRYVKQFTALDTLLSQLQTTSSYLTQQFDSLSALTKSSAK